MYPEGKLGSLPAAPKDITEDGTGSGGRTGERTSQCRRGSKERGAADEGSSRLRYIHGVPSKRPVQFWGCSPSEAPFGHSGNQQGEAQGAPLGRSAVLEGSRGHGRWIPPRKASHTACKHSELRSVPSPDAQVVPPKLPPPLHGTHSFLLHHQHLGKLLDPNWREPEQLAEEQCACAFADSALGLNPPHRWTLW